MLTLSNFRLGFHISRINRLDFAPIAWEPVSKNLAIRSSTKKLSVVSWKTKRIPRVCRSVKSAETRSLDDGLDDTIHIARIIKEIYEGKINLKEPSQIPVIAKTDSKSLWESLNNSGQCEEKLLRSTIAGLKELLSLGYVESVDWISTDVRWRNMIGF